MVQRRVAEEAMSAIVYEPIGTIHSPFTDLKGMPIQPAGAEGVPGSVELLDRFCAGLKDLDGFSHIILVYHFHLSKGYTLEARPFLDDVRRGIFAIRGPARPNPIGISVVRLVGVDGCTLHIEDVDIVDGTPLLDMKPYVPDFDCRPADRIGWLAGKSGGVRRARS